MAVMMVATIEVTMEMTRLLIIVTVSYPSPPPE